MYNPAQGSAILVLVLTSGMVPLTLEQWRLPSERLYYAPTAFLLTFASCLLSLQKLDAEAGLCSSCYVKILNVAVKSRTW